MIDIIKQFNWIDLLSIIVFLRICYISVNKGFPAEIFKFPGTILAVYLALHYYVSWANFVHERIGTKFIPITFWDFVFVVILALIGYTVFVFLRKFLGQLITMETVPNLTKWGGLTLGIIRGILLSSLILFILVISDINYLKESVANSFSGSRLISVAPVTYRGIWNGFISKFMLGEKFNEAVSEIQESFNKPVKPNKR